MFFIIRKIENTYLFVFFAVTTYNTLCTKKSLKFTCLYFYNSLYFWGCQWNVKNVLFRNFSMVQNWKILITEFKICFLNDSVIKILFIFFKQHKIKMAHIKLKYKTVVGNFLVQNWDVTVTVTETLFRFDSTRKYGTLLLNTVTTSCWGRIRYCFIRTIQMCIWMLLVFIYC